ncbi:hypothetical protein [Salininema proteolyticum]|uniref:Uncharacterized protein n=1 Tax=Salininema proteolyticum TaxID=1607685 RepID=A0ABV8TWI4_9ACTN
MSTPSFPSPDRPPYGGRPEDERQNRRPGQGEGAGGSWAFGGADANARGGAENERGAGQNWQGGQPGGRPEPSPQRPQAGGRPYPSGQFGGPQAGSPQGQNPRGGAPQAGRPQAGPPAGGQPNGPHSGNQPAVGRPQAGGRPSAGRPQAGGQPGGPQRPQAGGAPVSGAPVSGQPVSGAAQPVSGAAHPVSGRPASGGPQDPRAGQPGPRPGHDREAFEERAFDDSNDDWSTREHTQVISKLGYLPKDDREDISARRRREPQGDGKAWRRKKKGNPLVKIGVLVLVLALAGGAGWWFFLREDGESEQQASQIEGYQPVAESCALVDTSVFGDAIDTSEPQIVEEGLKDETERGADQMCVLGLGDPESGAATVTAEATVYSGSGSASVHFEDQGEDLSTAGAWSEIEMPAEQADTHSAFAADDNYKLFVMEDNVILSVTVYVSGVDSDEDQLGDWAGRIAEKYFADWER